MKIVYTIAIMVAKITKMKRTVWLPDKTSHPIEVSDRIESFINNLRQQKHVSIFKSIKEEYCKMSIIDLTNILDCISKNNIQTSFPKEIKSYVLILQVLSKRFRIHNSGNQIFDDQLIKEISTILEIPKENQVVLTNLMVQDFIVSNKPANIIT